MKNLNDFQHFMVIRSTLDTELLKKLHNDSQDLFYIRYNISQNKNCPEYILKEYINNKNEHFDVVYCATINTNLKKSTLEKMIDHENYLVRIHLIDNPNINLIDNYDFTIKILEKLSNDNNYRVREKIAKLINCPEYILEKLASDESEAVRFYVAQNKNTTLKTLKKLYLEFKEEVVQHPNWQLKEFI